MSAADRSALAREQAIDWFVRLSSGAATDADHRACASWRAADPLHEQAWARVDQVRQSLREVPGALASPALRRPARHRREILRGFALAGGAAGLGYAGWATVTGGAAAPGLLADQRTGVGEQRSVELTDGSLLMLNTDTAVDVRFDAEWRRLRLHRGEILIVTAHERGLRSGSESRPLVVDTPHGRVRALGTRFLMRADAQALRVSVLRSAVEIRSLDGSVQRVDAGHQIGVTRGGIGDVRPLDAESDAWTSGSLIVDNRRLADVLAELSRYRRGHLGCDPAVAELRVSGAFPVDDTERALAALAATLPVRIERMTRYWVTVNAR